MEISSGYRFLSYRYPLRIRDYSIDECELDLSLEDNFNGALRVAFTFLQNDIIKIQLARDAFSKPEYDFVNYAYIKPDDNVVVTDFGDRLEVKNCKNKAEFNKNPFSFQITDGNGRVIYKEIFDDVNPVGDGLQRIFPMGYAVNESGDIQGMNISALFRWDEHIYGLGERFTEFDKRGQKILMKNTDTLGCRDATAYKNIPFYVSTYGYGLFLNTHHMSEFNIGSESNASISIHIPNDQIEYYIITGSNIKGIVSKYMFLTGPAVLPPKWSFGLWYSTGFKGNSKEAVEADASKFRRYNIPCDVMHFDCYWLRDDMWCDFVWDTQMYPAHDQMLQSLHEQGFKVCLWINPYVTIKTDMFKEGEANEYLVKNSSGSVYTADLWHGLLSYCAIVDFTNPKAVQWYKTKVKALLSEGVDVVKTDFGEDIPYDAIFANGKTGVEIRNVYSRLYNEAVFGATQEVKGKEGGIVWARSGYTGMQKFPVCWSGDPRSSYEGMAATLRGGLSMAMSGVPFWSHDMGGFYGDVKEDVFIRWSQFGLFSSHSRLHGTTTRQPWAYGDKACAILVDFIRLRYKLMPYILKTAASCVKNGVPFIRPLVMENSDDPSVFGIWDEYYFGDDIIVAPVFGGDNVKRSIYLPCGEWQDFLTGEEFKGNNWYTIICPIEYMPILVKKDANISLNLQQT